MSIREAIRWQMSAHSAHQRSSLGNCRATDPQVVPDGLPASAGLGVGFGSSFSLWRFDAPESLTNRWLGDQGEQFPPIDPSVAPSPGSSQSATCPRSFGLDGLEQVPFIHRASLPSRLNFGPALMKSALARF